MAKIIGSFLIVLIAIELALSDEIAEFAKNNKNFAVKFYKQIFQLDNYKGKNVVFSPYSIQTAGALLYPGAGGKTATDMVTGFNLPSSDPKLVGSAFKASKEKHSKDNFFKMANKIYVAKDYSISPTYQEIAVNSFDSEVENVNFKESIETAKAINDWVSNKTAGHIKDIVQPDILKPGTSLLLVNAIHFKGQWKTEFKKDKTTASQFYSTPTEKVQIEQMSAVADFKFEELQQYGVRAAEYSFKDSDISMFFLLPNSVEKSLDEVEAKLSDLIEKEDIFSKLKDVKTGRFSIPKFKIEFDLNMEEPLKNLNMGSLFEGSDLVNLLDPPRPLSVSDALHKASIEVTEEGAEAAAATVINTTNRVGILIWPFTIEQSFLYFIKGSNGEIYFMGRFTGK